jgi:beta-glucosidase
VRRLKRFAKITLQPNEAREVVFHLAKRDFSYVDAGGESVSEPGSFTVLVGDLAKEVAFR